MKVLVAVALVLGLAGVILGVVALGRSNSAQGITFTRSTIALKSGEPDTRISYPAPGIAKDHPNGNLVEVRNSKVTGDAEGEYVRTCTPVVDDEIECNGAYRLTDGTIEIETTEHDDPGEVTAVASIVGGTGAYAGALGTVDVNFDDNTYVLHLLLPTG